MANLEIIDLTLKSTLTGSESIEIQDPAGGAGTSFRTPVSKFATDAQGTKADTATQPGDNVSTLTNDAGYLDDATAFATSAQGDTADSAVQTSSNVGPGAGLAEPKVGNNLPFKSLVAGAGIEITPNALDVVIAATATGAGEANTSSNVGVGEILALPKVGADLPFKTLVGGASCTLTPTANDVVIAVDTADFATAAQGTTADSAVQTVNNVSPVGGNVTLTTGTVPDTGQINKYATQAQLDSADSALQPGEAGVSSDADNLLVNGADTLSYLDQATAIAATQEYFPGGIPGDLTPYPDGFIIMVPA